MHIAPAASLVGDLAVPGDKSISHRALILGGIADGDSEVRGFGASADTATIVVYVGATAAKYPRSVTGDPYFDTSSVRMTYAPIGDPAMIYPLSLRILFPPP